MNPILFLSLVIILTAALPWWPYSAYGRLRHHRPWDWLLHSPSPEDLCITATESRTRRVHRTWLEKLCFRQHTYKTKIFDQRGEILGRGATPEASQRAAMKQASQEGKSGDEASIAKSGDEAMQQQLENAPAGRATNGV